MKNYSIMPLFREHIEDICQDIRTQYNTGVATLALFRMTLVPEGDPVIDKAALLCESYAMFKKRLSELDCDSGILVQASIGHGYPLDEMFPFQQVIRLSDGKPETICCPYDEGFRQHMQGQFRTLALSGPTEIMVDDDLRLMHRPGKGCACPLHMAAFNRKAGTNLTREQLYAHTQGRSELDRKYTRIFIETQKESVVGAAAAMRRGVDSVDPSIPGAFCSSGEAAEFGAEIGSVLAGKGNPVVVRLNNSNYHPAGAREFSVSMYKAAIQIAALNGRADVILAETDTCPQNRYSTGAQHLHSHFTGSILEGVSGAKHWITRLKTYEPNSGRAYRKILSEHAGFYETLTAITPSLRWHGCRIPVSPEPDYGLQNPDIWKLENDGWSTCVLERLGLPMYYSSQPGGVVFLDGYGDWRFTDEQIRGFFRGTVVLAAQTAKRLNERGFLPMTGVDVLPWTGENPSGEILAPDCVCEAQKDPWALRPISKDVRWDSVVYHLYRGTVQKPLFPGATIYQNPLGGTTVVFCGTPKTALHYTEGFSFLNESRKAQLIRLLSDAGCLPVFYPGDAEVYFRAASMPDGSLFCALFNIGLDPIDEIVLQTERSIKNVEILQKDGHFQSCPFQRTQEKLVLKAPAHILDPVILILK